MPEDSKKNQQKKNKNDPKDQRKPRQSRNQNSSTTEKKEKQNEPKAVEKILQEPGPEFYKNLKRETDEIIKISEETNSKYTKKEIYSNWKKYELPIESYDEIDEQENIGADYEELTQGPMVTGAHFQFKHERTWDSVTTSSEYDKYFDIDTHNLSSALLATPFYERNNIDIKQFSQIDISNMSNRAMKFKEKYDNATRKLVKTNKTDNVTLIEENSADILEAHIVKRIEEQENPQETELTPENVNLETIYFNVIPKTHPLVTEPILNHNISQDTVEESVNKNEDNDSNLLMNKAQKSNIDNIINENEPQNFDEDLAGIIKKENIESVNKNEDNDSNLLMNKTQNSNIENIINENEPQDFDEDLAGIIKKENIDIDNTSKQISSPKANLEVSNNKITSKVIEVEVLKPPKSNPVIQSSEDLEKWLDDFLDS